VCDTLYWDLPYALLRCDAKTIIYRASAGRLPTRAHLVLNFCFPCRRAKVWVLSAQNLSSAHVSPLIESGGPTKAQHKLKAPLLSQHLATMASELLEPLAQEIAALGEQIKALKASDPVDKAAVGAAVASLLAAKKNYAEHNNGIGVDGKPYEEPQSKKAQKKQAGKEAGSAKQVCSSRRLVDGMYFVTTCFMIYSSCGLANPALAAPCRLTDTPTPRKRIPIRKARRKRRPRKQQQLPRKQPTKQELQFRWLDHHHRPTTTDPLRQLHRSSPLEICLPLLVVRLLRLLPSVVP